MDPNVQPHQQVGAPPPRPPTHAVAVNPAQFVRPDQLNQITTLAEDQRNKFYSALTVMWQQYHNAKDDPESAAYKAAIASLTSASNKLRQYMAQNRGMQRPLSQGQPQQAGGMPQAGSSQQQNRPPAVGQHVGGAGMTSDSVQRAVKEKVSKIDWGLLGLPAGPSLDNIKNQYGRSLLGQMQSQQAFIKLKNEANQLTQAGQQPPQSFHQEHNRIATQLRDYTKNVNAIEARLNLNVKAPGGSVASHQGGVNAATVPTPPSFNLQMPPQANRQGSPTQAATMSPSNPSVTAGIQNRLPTATAQNMTPQQPQGQLQPQQQQGMQQNGAQPPMQNMQRPSINALPPVGQISSTPQQQNNAAGSQQTLSQALQNSAAARASFPHPLNGAPQSAITPQAAANGGAQPQSAYPNQANASRPEGPMSGMPKMPIPKTINPTPPVPVQMAQSRPTMAGPGNGVGAPGVMGQPVIQKPPGYTLEGDGGRVLDKKKLEELVRQVTGSDGGGAMSPEVEEAMFQIVDDFLDDVIDAACRLAKMRESATLDIRDIQIILERNYNIRIPGYAMDEVRMAKRFAPQAGWQQKMNAIHASKVMGGKTDG